MLGGSGFLPSPRLLLICSFSLLVWNSLYEVAVEAKLIAVEHAKGCHGQICIALDGSGSVAKKFFKLQKEFTTELIKRVSARGDIEVGVVQYGTITYPVSPMTKDIDTVIERLSKTVSQNDTSSAVGGPIVYCDSQINREGSEKTGKMVFLGDGRNSFGGDPILRANIFRTKGKEILAVTLGSVDQNSILGIVGDDSGLVFELGDGSGNQTERVVAAVGKKICT